MRKRNKLLLTAAAVAIAWWPVAFYGRPYPAFGGESLLLIFLAGLAVANHITNKKEERINGYKKR